MAWPMLCCPQSVTWRMLCCPPGMAWNTLGPLYLSVMDTLWAANPGDIIFALEGTGQVRMVPVLLCSVPCVLCHV
jgi:hypothetical protein